MIVICWIILVISKKIKSINDKYFCIIFFGEVSKYKSIIHVSPPPDKRGRKTLPWTLPSLGRHPEFSIKQPPDRQSVGGPSFFIS